MEVTTVDGDGSFMKKIISDNPIKQILSPIESKEKDLLGNPDADFPRINIENDTKVNPVDGLLSTLIGEINAAAAIGNIIREATQAGIDPVLALEAAKAKIVTAILVRRIVSGEVSFNYRDKSITKL